MRKTVVVALVIILVFSLCAPCFSAAVPAVEAIDLFGSLYSAYLVAHGLDAVVSNNGIICDGTDPLPEASWRELWQQNFDYYAPLVDDAITSAVDWVEGYLQDLRAEAAFGSGSSPSPSPDPQDNGVIGFQFSAQLSEFFDKMTNIVLKDKYDLSYSDSGFQHSSGSFDSALSSVYSSSWPIYDPSLGLSGISSYGRLFGVGSSSNYYGVINTSNVFLFAIPQNGYYYPAILKYDPDDYAYISNTSGSFYTKLDSGSVSSFEYNGITFYYNISPNLYFTSDQIADGVFIGSLSDAASYFQSSSSGSLIKLSPTDKYSNSPIPVPDTDSEDYVPQPQTIILNVPWPSDVSDPDFTDLTDPAVAEVVDPVIDAATSNSLDPVIPSSTPGAPSSVMPPFLPSQPPTFNFNLGGIWYYVVRWVNSVRSGAALIFSVFNNIPPAMFYPIFGSAVAVIVIGVWRRFVS